MLKVFKHKIIRKHKKLFILIGLAINVSMLLEMLGIAMIFPLFAMLISEGALGEKLWFIESFAEYFHVNRQKLVIMLAMSVLSLFTLRAFFQLASIWCQEKTIRIVQNYIRYDVLGQLFTREYQFHIRNKKGKLFSDLIEKTNEVGQFMTLGFKFLSSVIQIIFMTAVLLWLSYKILFIFGLLVLLFMFLSRRMAKSSQRAAQKLVTAKEKMMTVPMEALQGIRELLLFNGAKLFLNSFNKCQKEATSYGLKVALLSNVSKPFAELFIVLLLCSIIIYSKLFSLEIGADNISLLLTSMILIQRVANAMSSINSNYVGIMATLPSLDALENLQVEHEKSFIEKDAVKIAKKIELKNRIQFEHVTFSYERDKIVLDDLNLNFEYGKKTAIVGMSGGGKSTIVDLIARLIVPLNGKITIDGDDLNDINIQKWRRNIGFVSQDIFVFHDTVENNIRLGKPDATMDEVIEAAKLANAHDFIVELEKGYKTDIGEKGLKVSAGQRQRIGIARALVRDPAIMIFDEATSSLDTISEKRVQEAIDRASQNRTTITIAHRLSTISHYDRIYVLKDGQVAEIGNHDELIAMKGTYFDLSTS